MADAGRIRAASTRTLSASGNAAAVRKCRLNKQQTFVDILRAAVDAVALLKDTRLGAQWIAEHAHRIESVNRAEAKRSTAAAKRFTSRKRRARDTVSPPPPPAHSLSENPLAM